MPRIYDSGYNGNSQTASNTELVLIRNTSTSLVRIRRWSASVTTIPLPSAQQIAVVAYRIASGYTPGSGGTAGAITRHDSGDAAAKATVVIGNTTPSSVGIATTDNQGMYIYQGVDQIMCEPIPIAQGEAFSLVMGPTVAVQSLASYVEWEEIGG